MTLTGEHASTLAARGILAAAEAAHWVAFEAHGKPGWAYPVYNASGQPYVERRWKDLNGGHPKYLWLFKKPERAKYYFVPGFLSAIQQHNGTCWLAGGEPDVLAFNAAGIQNVFCWLDGEGSPPATLANDLALMGVTVLMYPADRDLAGIQSAYKVAQLLAESPITYCPLELPGEVGSKYDVNNLWIACEFVASTFEARLNDLPLLDTVTMSLYAKQTGSSKQNAAANVTNQIKAWRSDWQQEVTRALGPAALIENRRERWHCPLPGHDDHNPSFRFSEDQKPGFTWPMCTCGIQDRDDPWGELASALNVDSWADYKALRAAAEGYITPKTSGQRTLPLATAGSDQVTPPTPATQWVDMHDEYAKLARELRGETFPDIQPFVFPLHILHQFGGFARFARRQKVTIITGVSGGGKTLLLKTIMLILMRNGHDVIWWGPEWSPEEYAEQDLQRADGMSMDVLDNWRLWRHYEAQGPDVLKQMSAKYNLIKPAAAAVERAQQKIAELMTLPGHMYVIPNLEMPLDKVCELAKGIALLKRREGRDVLAFGFDYVGLAQKAGRQDWTWAEQVVGEVKAKVSGGANLHCFISAQVRKKDSEDVRAGEKLTQGSAQGLSDAQANLYLTLTPEVDEEGNFKDTAWLSVVKNSRGRKGKVRVYTDWQHLAVVDKEVETVDLNTYAPAYADNNGGAHDDND